MRAIFLDIDGVLNSEAFLRRLEARHRALGHEGPPRPKRATTCDCFKVHHQIDRDAVARLNRLVAATEAKLVISSSWRKTFDAPELERILVEHGLVAEIIGSTPEGHDEPEMLEVFGPLDRIFRGHEIDFWLRKHPEIDQFVILDDGSDMAMHMNRLVQTDCEEGLLDEHVELAIQVLAWDGKSAPSPIAVFEDQDDDEDEPSNAIVSTRSAANEDARRDFDGFDVDEELRRLRRALRDRQWRTAAELAANLDEHLCRGGSLPVAWLGPACMQETGDLHARLRSSIEAAAKMSSQERQDTRTGYVAVAPPAASPPSSSWGLHCYEQGCVEMLTLTWTTSVPITDEEAYERLCPAHSTAAVALGWRVWHWVWWCPTHTVAKRLSCASCLSPCPACSCVGGPGIEAIDEAIIDVPEPQS